MKYPQEQAHQSGHLMIGLGDLHREKKMYGSLLITETFVFLPVTQETDIGTWEVLDGVHGGRIAQYETLSAAKLGVEKFNLEMRK